MRPPSAGSADITQEDTSRPASALGRPLPGVVIVHSMHAPVMHAMPLDKGRVVLGRADLGPEQLDDDRMSREHAQVSFDGAKWTVRDLESRNGTYVDGRLVDKHITLDHPRVVRLGRTLYLVTPDLRAFGAEGVVVNDAASKGALVPPGCVAGPTLQGVLASIARAGKAGSNLLILGESGVGKELAALAFHAAGPSASGPLVVVNCAAIPETIAERLLFGAKKGAYSGANTDTAGYAQAADGGVLFLDEVGELSLEVQAKLLRFIETREALAVGASTPRIVDVRTCFATNRDLRAAVAEDRFRADLFYRIAQPEVRLPPLRERREEIPWLVVREIAAAQAGASPKLTAGARFIETCLLRPWPGNVRELLGEVRRAAHAAIAAGTTKLRPEDMTELGGHAIALASPARDAKDPLTKEAIEAALAGNDGNVTAAARALGLHRTQLYRLLKRFGIATSEGS